MRNSAKLGPGWVEPNQSSSWVRRLAVPHHFLLILLMWNATCQMLLCLCSSWHLVVPTSVRWQEVFLLPLVPSLPAMLCPHTGAVGSTWCFFLAAPGVWGFFSQTVFPDCPAKASVWEEVPGTKQPRQPLTFCSQSTVLLYEELKDGKCWYL